MLKTQIKTEKSSWLLSFLDSVLVGVNMGDLVEDYCKRGICCSKMKSNQAMLLSPFSEFSLPCFTLPLLGINIFF